MGNSTYRKVTYETSEVWTRVDSQGRLIYLRNCNPSCVFEQWYMYDEEGLEYTRSRSW